MHRRTDDGDGEHGSGRAGPRPAFKRRAALVGLLTAASLGVGVQASQASTVDWAVANNAYPALKDMRTYLQGAYGFSTLTANPSGQVGGFWNQDSLDSVPLGGSPTKLRGITSGNMRMQLRAAGPYTGCNPAASPNCKNGPVGIDAFFSADETNVDQTISGAACNTAVVTCPGDGSTKTAFAVGRLAIYSCDGTWTGSTKGADPRAPSTSPVLPVGFDGLGSGNGAPLSPRCEHSNISDPATVYDVVHTYLATPGNVLSVANPTSAPFGAASKAALIQQGFTWVDSGGAGAGQNVYTGSACDSAPAAPSAGYCQIRLESGISQVRGAVTAGSAPLGLVALSNIMNISWTSGTSGTGLGVPSDDPNDWTVVDPSEYTSYGDILQYGVINNNSNSAGKTALTSMLVDNWGADEIQNVLLAYGYGS